MASAYLVLALTLNAFALTIGENAFIQASAISSDTIDEDLRTELSKLRDTHHGHGERVERLEVALRPMFNALPKVRGNHLEHSVVRYALHRLMSGQFGWFMKGLEAVHDPNKQNQTFREMMEWVPDHLQDVLEKQVGNSGFGFPELVAVAATLEDLVHTEAIGRLGALYDLYGIPRDTPLDATKADGMLDSFIVVYTKGGNWTAVEAEEAARRTNNFRHNHKAWSWIEPWLRSLRAEMSKKLGGDDATFSYANMSTMVEQIGQGYASGFQKDCAGMKSALMGMEDVMPGRVLLSEFYAKALVSRWAFTEKAEYLRALGALDENDAAKPRVILPNYVASRPQCLEPSGFYAVCCPNECEGLFSHLEREVGEPTGSPEKISKIVAGLSTPTVEAPRSLSDSLLRRLDQVADANGGKVPLHGRLFAQWMHHAFPRECAYPHTSGATSPQTPDEWMKQNGQGSSQATEEEMVCYVDGPCAGGAAAPGTEHAHPDSDIVELPWSDAEELLVPMDMMVDPRKVLANMQAFNSLLRSLVLSAMVFGLAARAKLPELDMIIRPQKVPRANSFQSMMTLALLAIPLLIMTGDYFLGFGVLNELPLYGLCWGLVLLIGLRHAKSSNRGQSEWDAKWMV